MILLLFAPLARPCHSYLSITPMILLLFVALAQPCHSYLFITPMILLLFVPLARPCCSAPLVSNWYSAPLGEEGVEELSKYNFLFVGVECGRVVQIQVL
jgi:hypothetical protein